MLILPADHLIEQKDSFIAACERAIKLAKANKLVTFGIKPTTPETGYGYIEIGQPHAETPETYNVIRFVEKPSLETAEEYLQSGRYFGTPACFALKLNDPPAIQRACTCHLSFGRKLLGFSLKLESSYMEFDS